MRVKHLTTTPLQTKKLGEILAKEILKSKLKKGALIIGLEGDLGGGKTTFLQGFARELGIKEKILSPTFIILRKFLISKVPSRRAAGGLESQFLNFFHIDCYRIEKPKEILDLGFKEIISNPKNIVTIEWAERIQKILPAETIILKFEFINQKTRKITVGLKNE
ncbi:MAG: tRNA (adenosine(37)-N6)-threonylcarbamoyltransferase complex ATPase subunit type 1 TsaE [Candidatus Nealsonbacteria bacterium]|nr:MAG: tRNA (adenosine(37)-N6)-threonylcarbamoyltransferase complex ATPase subunit type 1 TsaE [Candidatus Nealsonbacteria bacterium]